MVAHVYLTQSYDPPSQPQPSTLQSASDFAKPVVIVVCLGFQLLGHHNIWLVGNMEVESQAIVALRSNKK